MCVGGVGSSKIIFNIQLEEVQIAKKSVYPGSQIRRRKALACGALARVGNG